MEFSFTLFEPKKERAIKETAPYVEIRPNGRIVFNRQATELLANNTYCMLGYDSTNKALGILPLAEPQINAFPVRYAAKGAYIGAKKFFKHFGILPAEIIKSAPIQTGQFIGVKI